MPRIKEREKVLYQPSTNQVFLCLGDMPLVSSSISLPSNCMNCDQCDYLFHIIANKIYLTVILSIMVQTKGN